MHLYETHDTYNNFVILFILEYNSLKSRGVKCSEADTPIYMSYTIQPS